MSADNDANPDILKIWWALFAWIRSPPPTTSPESQCQNSQHICRDGRVYSKLGTGPRQVKAQFAPVEASLGAGKGLGWSTSRLEWLTLTAGRTSPSHQAYTVTLYVESTCLPHLDSRQAAINFLRDPARPRVIQVRGVVKCRAEPPEGSALDIVWKTGLSSHLIYRALPQSPPACVLGTQA